MPFLYEKIDTLREVGVLKELPQYIPDNLNPNFELRPYQTAAFENFITYFENDKLCQKPTQTLFHMATGSGKTLIMAGLMLYLYKHGYRNFLFFVNLSNIVQKTKENFLNSVSSKFLFADEITIDGKKIKIKEVSNFQYSDDTAIIVMILLSISASLPPRGFIRICGVSKKILCLLTILQTGKWYLFLMKHIT